MQRGGNFRGIRGIRRVRVVARRRSMRLRDGDWDLGRLFRWTLYGGGGKFSLYVGSILYGEITLSLQKIDVCPSLGDNMEDEGRVRHGGS